MRFVTSIVLAFLVFALLCYSAYRLYPRTIAGTYTVSHMVPEQRTQIAKGTVVVDGKSVEVELPFTETYFPPAVPEQRERAVVPTPIQKLQFYCIAGVAVIFGIYVLIVIGLFARDKFTRKANSADVRDTRHRMDGVSTFCVGILVGLIGGHQFESEPISSDPPSPAAIQVDEPATAPTVSEPLPRFQETRQPEPTSPIHPAPTPE